MSSRKKSFGHSIRQVLFHFPDLKYDGTALYCLVCDVPLLLWNTNQWKKHVTSARHIKNRKNQIPHATFMFDLICTLTVCNVSVSVVNRHFRQFWSKYVQNWKLPARGVLKSFLRVRQRIENDIKRELRNKKLWVTVDEVTDTKRNVILNVLVRILSPNGSSAPYLLASKRIKQLSAQASQQMLLQTLKKFRISNEQVLMFVTDDTPVMMELGQSLKSIFPNLIYLTCLIHALHLVSEMIRRSYKNVDTLIMDTQKVFYKFPKRIQKFHKRCPKIPEPPQSTFTRWNTWLEAIFYYSEHFDQIKSFILKLNPVEVDVRKSQEHFSSTQIQTDLQKICEDYVELVDAIQKLRTGYLPLISSLQTLDSVEAKLQKLAYDSEFNIVDSFREALSKNQDYAKLWNIYGKYWNDEPLNDLEKHLLFANLTTIDIETCLAVYKKILSPQCNSLKQDVVETYTMMKVYTLQA